MINRGFQLRNASASMVVPMVIPSSNVTRLESVLDAVSDNLVEVLPHSRIRLPNIRAPIRATLQAQLSLILQLPLWEEEDFVSLPYISLSEVHADFSFFSGCQELYNRRLNDWNQ